MHAYVIGNVTIDETIAVSEMPVAGASVLGRQQSRDLGGKGANQAVVMARCGLPTSLIAAIGEGFRANIIREHLAEEPVVSHLVPLTGRSSDFSIVLTTPDGENLNVTTTDAAQNLPLADAVAALADAAAGDLAILQGNLTDKTTRGVLEAARARSMVTAFNPSPLRSFFASLWPLIDIAFLNEGEALALTGTSGESAARTLLSAGLREVVLTFGSHGAMLVTDEGVVRVPAAACETVDTTGAGDTFMAVALASAKLRATRLDRTAVEHATRAAAITVSRPGTRSAFPTASELAKILASR
ncbi:ribokinase [Sinorhizobium numidicum]|uniref:Ribokinase n=1 Tax=Sinorhizobium numidicum TaxID=680248 RepID=A0ABY8CQV6_9HYPH|nr:ribokinase [Sinorhizobium numidicum]WEX75042.1 ribokinase [Sinorhizobium numidicum]WEX81036.1 ribokinase [Sinorhizobium numidicum]